MDDKELKEYIDTTKKDLVFIVEGLKQEVLRLEDNTVVSSVAIEKKIQKLREFQLTCPITKELNRVKGKVFRNNVLVYIFMSGLMALAWLQLQRGYDVQPKDVLKQLIALEKKIDIEIEREKRDDIIERDQR